MTTAGPYNVNPDVRTQIRDNAYNWRDNSFYFYCRRGVWVERTNARKAARRKLRSVIVETDQGIKQPASCVFSFYTPRISFPDIITSPKTPTPLASGEKIKLRSQKISFDDETATITIGQSKIKLPPNKFEHCFCRVMFSKKVNKAISWETVYEKAIGNDDAVMVGQAISAQQQWHRVYDIAKAINNRIKKEMHTDDKLFTCGEDAIERNF